MSSIVITAEFQFVQIDLACAGKVGKIPKGVAGVSGGIRRFGNRLRRFRLGLRRVAVLRRCFAERGHDTVLDLLKNEAAAAEERLRKGKEELEKFSAAVRAVCDKEIQLLNELPQAPVELPQEEAKPEDSVQEIEDSVII